MEAYRDHIVQTISSPAWARIGIRRRAGVLTPLFSVYSRRSLGIGDFEDLKLLVDWCVRSGATILQLLPMNELSGTFCPYDAVSAFAVEPVYIALDALEATSRTSVGARIGKIRAEFPAGTAHVDYGIREEKIRLLRELFHEDADLASTDFVKFIAASAYWLEDFALFKVLKNYHGGSPWYDWEIKYKERDAAELTRFAEKHAKDILFEKWVQWIACRQFAEAKAYARRQGVFIKGDLPILISRDSADVWAHPGFFKLEYAAGAPPDMYCAKGQRWGMPTYNWETLAADGYRYLKEKLTYAEHFYDIIRVDHVVGLFRIWSIPHASPFEREGLDGQFDPADEGVWRDHGRTVLSAMAEHTTMLLCAEDLGVVPGSCPETLWDFGMPGNDVQRWTKDWAVRHDFLNPSEYRLLSVAMLSTHDTTNWPAWWENEAGTVDEALFVRKCVERGIDYASAKDRLFDPELSRHGRLRWLKDVSSTEVLAAALERPLEEIGDFVDLYLNTYLEKEKLWKHLKLKGKMHERSSPAIVEAVLKITLAARSVFSIELMTDYLFLSDCFKGDPYKYRTNRPGTVSKDNWSLTMPAPLEELIEDKLCGKIKALVTAAGR